MNDNPYQAPADAAHAIAPGTSVEQGREYLRGIALHQRNLLLCILVYLLGSASLIILQAVGLDGLATLSAFLVLASMVLGAVFALILAIRLYGAAAGILLGMLSLVPCLGLVALLIVNGKATSTLRAGGLYVGMLGVNLSKI